jgi:hypothetical protein
MYELYRIYPVQREEADTNGSANTGNTRIQEIILRFP